MAQEMETEVERLRGEVVRLQQRVLAQQMELDNLKNQSGPADHAHERGSNNVDDLGGADLLWRACPPLKCSVVRPHLVTLGDTIYVGGGNTPNQEMCRRVHKLVPRADKWESLPITPYLTFALAGVNGHPTVIGGVNIISSLTSADLLHFDADVNKWKKTLPPMPTRRRAASATTLRNNLVVAGGIHEEDGKSYLSTVEVLDTEKQLWSRVCSLPKPTNFMSMTSCELTDRIYLLGGLSKQGSIRSVFSCVFTDLLNSASPSSDGEMTRDAKSEPDSRVWEDIAQTPYHRMGCITISGRLVVASGLDKGNQATRPVYVLDPISRKWETVGEMAAARSSCSLVSRGRGRLMVVGGYIDPRHWIASLTTDVMECINLKLE